jgi:hypothetical protein
MTYESDDGCRSGVLIAIGLAGVRIGLLQQVEGRQFQLRHTRDKYLRCALNCKIDALVALLARSRETVL